MGVLAAARGMAEIVFLCDRDLPYVRARFDDVAALAEAVDVTGLPAHTLADRVGGLRLAGITTFSEHQLNRTAALAQRHGLAFHDRATARALTDKYVQRRILAAAGVQHTACRVVRGVADLAAAVACVGLPAVLKPRRGAASAYTCRVDSVAEAAGRLRDFAGGAAPARPVDFVLEELLVGDGSVAGPGWADYVSVESVTSGGVVRHVEITGKFPLAAPFRETGYVIPSTLDEAARQAVFDLTTAAVRALGVQHGATHVEVKLGRGGPQVIEVNGRVGGYVADLLSRARRVDLVRMALAAALGRAPDPPADSGYRRHAFQYFLTPPVDAVALRSLDGVTALGRRPGIQAVEILKQPGESVDWRAGTLAYVGIVHGAAEDHRGVLDLVEMINRTLVIRYDTVGGAAAAPPRPAQPPRPGSSDKTPRDRAI